MLLIAPSTASRTTAACSAGTSPPASATALSIAPRTSSTEAAAGPVGARGKGAVRSSSPPGPVSGLPLPGAEGQRVRHVSVMAGSRAACTYESRRSA